jgi:hypothetical protein
MSTLWGAARRFGLFWYAFVVGDDWAIAAGVVAGVGAAYGLVAAGSDAAWLVLPAAAIAILAVSIRRANRRVARRG